MMDIKIYYIPEYQGISITSNFAEIKRMMDIGVNPKVEYKEISKSDFHMYPIKSISFEMVDNDYFQNVTDIFVGRRFEYLSFYDSVINFSDVLLNVKHLVIGQKCKVDLSANNFKDLEEITFLELKSFKGKIVSEFNSVEKIVLWFESKKANGILTKFPSLKRLDIFNGSETKLDLRTNKDLESLKLGNLSKLEEILFDPATIIITATIENCKKLNLGAIPKS